MHVRHFLVLAATLFFALSICRGADRITQSERLKFLFMDPPREYSTAPLWVWNDQLTDEQVLSTLRDLAGQKVKQAFVHPRPGLMTTYLSDHWFRLWALALKEAERLDMNLWIYDENSYPSGFAGGFVPEAMPESRGRGLIMREDKNAPRWSEDLQAIFSLSENTFEEVTEKVRSGATLPEGRYLAVSIARARPSPWYGGKYYVDLLYPGVTEKFLSITMDAYKQRIGDQFGKRVPGAFTDEPHIRPAGGFPWTDNLPQLFEKRWGYRLTDHLPALREPLGDWRRVRHNYYQLLLEQFIERWAKPFYDYCARNQLEFTGHYWEHEWPNCISVPDNMAMSAWQQRPGIDILMNQYREDTHAQFGNVRAVKELASVANQLGRSRTLAEGYGAGGWDLRFEDMKRIGDWMYVLGVNTLDEHLSYISIRGARKRDHPQSFSYHEPWWEAYNFSETYFTRLSLALANGRQVNHIILLEPTTTAWMYNTTASNPPALVKLGDAFQQIVVDLEKAQVEYDLGCEDILARHGSVVGSLLNVGQRSYRTVVIPPLTENLNARTLALLEAFVKGGGTILSCGPPPERIDGNASDRGAALAQNSGWKHVEAGALPELLAPDGKEGFAIRRAPADKGILYHHRRQLDDGQLLFLVNSSIESSAAGTVESDALGIERWDLATGKIEPAIFDSTKNGSRISFELPPSGSILLFLSKERKSPAPAINGKLTEVATSGPLEIRRTAPNVLVIDYLDITAGGETRKSQYFYQASQFVFQKNGLERNPWDSAVQFRDEFVTKKFPEGSGFEASYRFVIEEQVPKNLSLVVERPDLYTLVCNGKSIQAAKESWWLDKAFGRINIAPSVRVGENEVILKASPMTIYHEIEAVYVLGDFDLKATEKGFAIVPEKGLRLGAWNQQGCAFYGNGVSYKQKFSLNRLRGQYHLSLPRWYGSVAKVNVNDKPAGFVAYPPWQLDVTKWLKAGPNIVEVIVIGTLKNTLGPHHGNPALGTAWPAMFQKAPIPGPPPGAGYSTVEYGLMQPFALIQRLP